MLQLAVQLPPLLALTGRVPLAIGRRRFGVTPKVALLSASNYGSIDTPADTDTYTFLAKGGEGVSARVGVVGGAFSPCVDIYAPDGSLVPVHRNRRFVLVPAWIAQ